MAAGAPPDASWVASIHASEHAAAPLGMAVVVDERRLLTSAHVVVGKDGVRTGLWVAFPLCEDDVPDRCAVAEIRVAAAYLAGSKLADTAVLELAEPVPPGVAIAPLRLVKPSSVVDRAWWAFGFPQGRQFGYPTSGDVTGVAGNGWVLLPGNPRGPVQGFSGSGLWSSEYGAVVGLIGQANDLDTGLALTLHTVDRLLPAEKIELLTRWTVRSADTTAQLAWSWTLTGDVEADRHWRPRARGVAVSSERGHRFQGRRTALTEIVAWLDRAHPDRRVLVVTGSPGVGKSAVLGRIVTTADVEMSAALPGDDHGVRATVGSVGCAVHAKGKTALDVACEIARAASVDLPDRPDDLAPALATALAERDGRRFNVIVDALDEATGGQAREIIRSLLLPVAQTCADQGVQVVVGTRPADGTVDLLAELGPAATVIDLDDAGYFARDDLTAYARATLQLRGAERPDNPYQDDAVAGPVAARIAELAEPNFLVAGLVARTHGLYDRAAIDPSAIAFTADVHSALTGYVARLPGVGGVSATDVLTALAFAEAPGLTPSLWRVAVEALTGGTVEAAALARFARGSAANFLVESAGGRDGPVDGASFRLFHQALGDVLRAERARFAPVADDQAALTAALLARGRAVGWKNAEAYLLRSLPSHARAAGRIDELLADVYYLLHADLRRLLLVLGDVRTPAGTERARLLRLTPRAVDASPGERLSLLGVTEVMETNITAFRGDRTPAPYRALWARTRRRVERSVFEGHTGPVNAMCPIRVDGCDLLATAGDDATVAIWDPTTGETRHTLTGHTGGVRAVCPIRVDGRDLLATAGTDRTVRIWDPTAEQAIRELTGHAASVHAMCPITVDGHDLLATASSDGSVRIWDPTTGETLCTLTGHTDGVRAVCPIRVDGRDLLATAGADRTVQIWNAITVHTVRTLTGHAGWVNAVCPTRIDDHDLLATASADRTVRIWDPTTGDVRRTLTGHNSEVNAVCPIRIDGHDLLATAGDDATVRICNPATGDTLHTLTGHTRSINAVCPLRISGRDLLATASYDTTVRIWDPTHGETPHNPIKGIRAVCSIRVDGDDLLVTASSDATVRVWDPTTGIIVREMTGHADWVNAVCPIRVHGHDLLATAGDDQTVRIWDPTTGTTVRELTGHAGWVNAVCPIRVDGHDLLATAGGDRTVRIWDPATGDTRRTLTGGTGRMNALCPIRVHGHDLLATAGDDQTVRIWDPATGLTRRTLTGHIYAVRAVCPIHVDGRDLLATAGTDRTVRIWDPTTGHTLHTFSGHSGYATAVCPVRVGGRDLLATAGADRTVRIWDPTRTSCVLVVPVHHEGRALCSWAPDHLAVGLDAGLLALRIDETTLVPSWTLRNRWAGATPR